MNSRIAPDEPDYQPFSAAGQLVGTDDSDQPSARLLYELGRFLHRIAADGINSPLDRAMLNGATEMFQSLLSVCNVLSEQEPGEDQDDLYHTSMAGYRPIDLDETVPEGLESLGQPEFSLAAASEVLDSCGPADVVKMRGTEATETTKKKRKKATSVKKRAKRKSPKKGTSKKSSRKKTR